jgi:hypothetical protein
MPSVKSAINSWGLPDPVYVEVFLRLREELPDHPVARMWRADQPFDGMHYGFTLIDPQNRLCVHLL